MFVRNGAVRNSGLGVPFASLVGLSVGVGAGTWGSLLGHAESL